MHGEDMKISPDYLFIINVVGLYKKIQFNILLFLRKNNLKYHMKITEKRVKKAHKNIFCFNKCNLWVLQVQVKSHINFSFCFL